MMISSYINSKFNTNNLCSINNIKLSINNQSNITK